MLLLLVVGRTAAYAAGTELTVSLIEPSGLAKQTGSLRLSDSKAGLRIKPRVSGSPAGEHGFHVHDNPDCGAAAGPNGKPAAGMAAGGHYDPANTGKHFGPDGSGHKGDLPFLTVDAKGKASKTVIAPHRKLADVKGHAIMIHAGDDNYSDRPAPLGGGGARIACGIVK